MVQEGAFYAFYSATGKFRSTYQLLLDKCRAVQLVRLTSDVAWIYSLYSSSNTARVCDSS